MHKVIQNALKEMKETKMKGIISKSIIVEVYHKLSKNGKQHALSEIQNKHIKG